MYPASTTRSVPASTRAARTAASRSWGSGWVAPLRCAVGTPWAAAIASTPAPLLLLITSAASAAIRPSATASRIAATVLPAPEPNSERRTERESRVASMEPAMSSPHLTPEEFREHGHQVVDWIADYWSSVGERPVLAQVQPGEVAAALPTTIPDEPESLDAVLADLDRVLVPGLTHWQHPRFFAYFPANSSPAGVLGDLLSSGIGAQGMIWATSPAVTELEQVVLDQLRVALGLPDAFARDGAGGGVIQDTASTATFTAVLAALHRATDGGARRDGVPAGRFTIYGSTQAHSSLLKAAMMSGLGEAAVRAIAVDPKTQAMDVAALRDAMAADVAAGLTPVLVQAAVGTTSTGAVDRSPRSHRSLASTAPGCTSTRPGRASRRSAPSTAGSTTAWSTPTPTSPTRTSGC